MPLLLAIMPLSDMPLGHDAFMMSFSLGPAKAAHIVCIAAGQDNARDQAGATPPATGCDQPGNTCGNIQICGLRDSGQDDVMIGALLNGEHASSGLPAWGTSSCFGRRVS